MNARMKEVWIAVHRKNADAAMEELQALGLVHLSYAPAESLPPPERFEELEKLDHIIHYPYFEKEKKDLVENFASLQKKVEAKDIRGLAEQGISNLAVYGELREIEKRIEEMDKRRHSLNSLTHEIRSLRFKSEIPLHKIGETRKARTFLSHTKPADAECEQVGEKLYLCAIPGEVQAPPAHIQLGLLGLEGNPKEIARKALEEEKDLRKERLELIKKARKRQALLTSFKAAFDYLSAKKAKADAMRRSTATKNTMVLHGWVRAKEEGKLETLSDCEWEARDPQGDNAPTALENPGPLKPFETVTKVFGVPRYTEVDPTPYLALFFVVSMALCLTDAGYGLMLAILASILYLRYGIKFGMLLLYGGILAIVVGAMIGGWFGNLGDYVPLFRPILYPKGITPIDFLMLSLAIGILQITVSLLIAAREKIRSGQLESALIDTMPWVVFLMAVVSVALDSAGAVSFKQGIYIAGACVAFVMLTRGRHSKSLADKVITGLVAPYDLVTYMGDILSFTRLLALGLTSGLIGGAINIIAVLSFNIPVIGILLAPLILIFGHTFNLLLSTLSAYVHSSRLQYVEFFNRFYSGGGFAFQPFSKGYKYVKEV